LQKGLRSELILKKQKGEVVITDALKGIRRRDLGSVKTILSALKD